LIVLVSNHSVGPNTKTYADGAVATRNRQDMIVQVRIAKTEVVFKETRRKSRPWAIVKIEKSPANMLY
jgi:hypothetical protein